MNVNRLHYLLGRQESTLATIRMILSKEEDYISTTSLTLIRGLLDLPMPEIDVPPPAPASAEEPL